MGLSNAEYINTRPDSYSPLHANHIIESMVFMYLLVYLVLIELTYFHNFMYRKSCSLLFVTKP